MLLFKIPKFESLKLTSMRSVIIAFCTLLLAACGEDVCRDEHLIEGKEVDIKVERLEDKLFQAERPEEVTAFLAENPTFSRYFLHSDQYPSDTVLAQKIYSLTSDPFIDTLYDETIDAYSDLQDLEGDLEMVFGKLQALYPETKTPVLQTAVTGLYNDLFISDSLIMVGLDFFIGEGASYRPLEVPAYILRRYDPVHLPAIITKVLAGTYVAPGKTGTLLSEMIDFGKTYFLTSRLLPCTPDSILIGYTPREIELSRENEHIIWANFVENEVLYETSHITKRRFLGERPNVYEISQECPGRIGAWIGWQIVESYMDNNDVTIRQLMEETDHEKIFRQSGYKPLSR